MTALTTLDFLYPWFSVSTDPRYAGDLVARQRFIDFAESYRPNCLPVAKADEAVAHYTAYLMNNFRLESAGASIQQTLTVTKETEGDVSREYATSLLAKNSRPMPISPYQRWEDLYRLCRAGSILVSTAIPAQPDLPSGFR